MLYRCYNIERGFFVNFVGWNLSKLLFKNNFLCICLIVFCLLDYLGKWTQFCFSFQVIRHHDNTINPEPIQQKAISFLHTLVPHLCLDYLPIVHCVLRECRLTLRTDQALLLGKTRGKNKIHFQSQKEECGDFSHETSSMSKDQWSTVCVLCVPLGEDHPGLWMISSDPSREMSKCCLTTGQGQR